MIIFELIYIAYADLEASGGWRFQPPNPENLIYKKIIDLPTKNRPLTDWHLHTHPSKQINKLSLRPPIKKFLDPRIYELVYNNLGEEQSTRWQIAQSKTD